MDRSRVGRAATRRRARLARIGAASLAALLITVPALPLAAQPSCEPAATITIPAKVSGGVQREPPAKAYKLADGSIIFLGRFTIDADGAPKSYHPVPRNGLDALANAGAPGNWWALATDAVDARGRTICTSAGNPIVQTAQDPAPGFYVSRTTMTNPAVRDCRRQARYVDSASIAYVALPGAVAAYDYRTNTGNLAMVANKRNGKSAFALFADVAPRHGRGEGSIKLAELLGYNANPRSGGTNTRENVFLILPSRLGFPASQQLVDNAAGAAFEAWGGQARLAVCAAKLDTLPK